MDVIVRRLQDSDLEEADKILRLSFGTFFGLADPMTCFGDADYVKTRFHADPDLTVAAEVDGRLVGFNFIANWGSVGFFGPLCIHPEFWNKGIANKLLSPTMDLFAKLNIRQAGLFTFANSTKHVHLYQKYGFWPRFLSAIMSKNIKDVHETKEKAENDNTEEKHFTKRFSEISKDKQVSVLEDCLHLTNNIYEGLDLRKEIRTIHNQKLGDTIVLYDNMHRDQKAFGLALCHFGAGTEAGSDVCYIKFGAVLPSENTKGKFVELLSAVKQLASENNISKITAGVNLERHNAAKTMLNDGFKTDLQGVSMYKPNEQGYNLPNAYVIDDMR
jgi:N-acetylglutamate synthase-like GNAT family acetyltransferase